MFCIIGEIVSQSINRIVFIKRFDCFSEVIVNRLSKFNSENEQFEGYSWAALPKSVQLKLILYDIEIATHFNGEGVWLDRKKDGLSS